MNNFLLSCALLLCQLVCAYGAKGEFLDPALVQSPGAVGILNEESDLALLVVDEPPAGQMEVETLVYDPASGGASHIKVGHVPIADGRNPIADGTDPRLYNLQAALEASKALLDEGEPEMASAEDLLEESVQKCLAGSRLDRNTPRDGHCLLHALMRGGLMNDGRVPLSLTVRELRAMALSVASPEELEVAAASTGDAGVSVATYKRGMLRNMWGDNLLTSCLARVFHQDITIISRGYTRTYLAAGGELEGPLEDAVWIAHLGEWHYFGVLRGDRPWSDHLDVPRLGGPAHALARTQRIDGDAETQNYAQTERKPTPAMQPVLQRRLRGKQKSNRALPQCPAPEKSDRSQPKCPKGNGPANVKKGFKRSADGKPKQPEKPSQEPSSEKARMCGNCGRRGHQAVTCVAPCLACGGQHKYFECDDPDLYHVAMRQAQRNRVKWCGYGARELAGRKKKGMKESGAGRHWIRQPYDPEYTPSRDVSPRRQALKKRPHPSDRCESSLRVLWDQTESLAMESLMDSGVLTDVCLSADGADLDCKGVLRVQYYNTKELPPLMLHCLVAS